MSYANNIKKVPINNTTKNNQENELRKCLLIFSNNHFSKRKLNALNKKIDYALTRIGINCSNTSEKSDYTTYSILHELIFEIEDTSNEKVIQPLYQTIDQFSIFFERFCDFFLIFGKLISYLFAPFFIFSAVYNWFCELRIRLLNRKIRQPLFRCIQQIIEYKLTEEKNEKLSTIKKLKYIQLLSAIDRKKTREILFYHPYLNLIPIIENDLTSENDVHANFNQYEIFIQNLFTLSNLKDDEINQSKIEQKLLECYGGDEAKHFFKKIYMNLTLGESLDVLGCEREVLPICDSLYQINGSESILLNLDFHNAAAFDFTARCTNEQSKEKINSQEKNKEENDCGQINQDNELQNNDKDNENNDYKDNEQKNDKDNKNNEHNENHNDEYNEHKEQQNNEHNKHKEYKVNEHQNNEHNKNNDHNEQQNNEHNEHKDNEDNEHRNHDHKNYFLNGLNDFIYTDFCLNNGYEYYISKDGLTCIAIKISSHTITIEDSKRLGLITPEKSKELESKFQTKIRLIYVIFPAMSCFRDIFTAAKNIIDKVPTIVLHANKLTQFLIEKVEKHNQEEVEKPPLMPIFIGFSMGAMSATSMSIKYDYSSVVFNPLGIGKGIVKFIGEDKVEKANDENHSHCHQSYFMKRDWVSDPFNNLFSRFFIAKPKVGQSYIIDIINDYVNQLPAMRRHNFISVLITEWTYDSIMKRISHIVDECKTHDRLYQLKKIIESHNNQQTVKLNLACDFDVLYFLRQALFRNLAQILGHGSLLTTENIKEIKNFLNQLLDDHSISFKEKFLPCFMNFMKFIRNE